MKLLTRIPALFLLGQTQPLPAAEVQPGEMACYLLVPQEKVPATFNAGFSLYASAWPVLNKYPGHQFQTLLFGAWMFAQNDPKPPGQMYSDIEGGLGGWRDTRFPTEVGPLGPPLLGQVRGHSSSCLVKFSPRRCRGCGFTTCRRVTRSR